jgi:hypothetical protein
MERRALVLALALTLPLALYAIPYAYASVTSSSYEVAASIGQPYAGAHCNPGDYATGGGARAQSPGVLAVTEPESYDFASGLYSVGTSGTPNAWFAISTTYVQVWVVCQTPITVAGIGVPQFGSLYAAVALGAFAYFVLSRRYASRRTSTSLA